MPQAKVGKWGKNLTVRLPCKIVRAAGLSSGQRVEITAKDGEIVIRRIDPRLTLEELFRGKTPGEWRAAYASVFDCGPDVGREAVEA